MGRPARNGNPSQVIEENAITDEKELPPTSEMLERCDLLKSPDNRSRARILVHKYLNGETSLFEIKELESMGILKKETVNESVPKEVDKSFCTQREFAKICAKKFGGLVSQKDVSLAKKAGWFAPACTGQNGSINVRIGLEIWEKNKSAKTGSFLAQRDEYKAQREKAEAEMAQRENERQRRKFDAEWMLKSEHVFWMKTFAARMRTSCQSVLEKQERRPDLFDNLIAVMGNEMAEAIKQADKNNDAQKEKIK